MYVSNTLTFFIKDIVQRLQFTLVPCFQTLRKKCVGPMCMLVTIVIIVVTIIVIVVIVITVIVIIRD